MHETGKRGDGQECDNVESTHADVSCRERISAWSSFE
jgi:hypothetical protein